MADSLEKVVSRESVDVLIEFLQHETDEETRTIVVYLLREIGGKDLSSILQMFGTGGSDEVKHAIRSALEKLQE